VSGRWSAALKLEGLRGVAVAWIEDVLASGGGPDLEAVMAELPKDVARTVITSSVSPEVEDFVERYARRAARIGPPVPAAPGSGGGRAESALSGRSPHLADVAHGPVAPASPVTYVLVTPAGRAKALERVLDEVDPPSAAIYVRTDDSEHAVRETLRALGYVGDTAVVRVVRDAVTEHTALLLLYDLPYDADELRRAVGGEPGRAMALLRPRQLRHLRSLTAEPVTPFVFAAPTIAARAHEDALRAELRRELATGAPAREVLTLEPLLAEYDGVALAAAALRILERARATPAAPTSVVTREPVGPRPVAQGRPADRGRDSAPRGPRDSGHRSGPRSEGGGRGPRPSAGERPGQRDRGPSRPDTRPLPRQPR
jgi:ATP-dependent RNA helicase DeaD